MLPQEIIRLKRDGGALPAPAIQAFVRGIADGRIGEGQMAALAMAILLRGLVREEKVALTQAMAASGAVLDWRGERLDGPVLDKHSTGGVGDKVSLLLAPIVAACGGYVPMLSGRGLGHTGGTLDKMAAIPGYRIDPDLGLFRRVVRDAGCAIIGATAEIAPADCRLYAVRDVTATVESIDLMTASILSKKLAAGVGALVMDVKAGSGAFLPALCDAERLAESLVDTARSCGLSCAALITDMNAVLGVNAGNALEVAECAAILASGRGDARLVAVTLALSGALLHLGGLTPDAAVGTRLAEAALRDGRAAERFARMIRGLGGPADFLERSDRYLARAPVVGPVLADRPGKVAAIDVRSIGLVIVELGGGRTRTDEAIDPAVGLTEVAAIGATVGPAGAPLAIVHAADRAGLERAAATIRGAFTIGDAASEPASPILRWAS